jgi:hypothetical protein
MIISDLSGENSGLRVKANVVIQGNKEYEPIS